MFATPERIVSEASGVYEVCLYAGTTEEVRFVRYTFAAYPPLPTVMSKFPEPVMSWLLIVLIFVPETSVSCFAFKAVCVADDIGLFASLVLSTFQSHTVFFVGVDGVP